MSRPMDAGDKLVSEGMLYDGSQTRCFRGSAFLQRGDFRQVAFQQLLEGGALRLGTGDEQAVVEARPR